MTQVSVSRPAVRLPKTMHEAFVEQARDLVPEPIGGSIFSKIAQGAMCVVLYVLWAQFGFTRIRAACTMCAWCFRLPLWLQARTMSRLTRRQCTRAPTSLPAALPSSVDCKTARLRCRSAVLAFTLSAHCRQAVYDCHCCTMWSW